MVKHLAIFSPKAVEQIFAGKKTVETRFSKKRIAPFGQVSVGDIIYIKPIGKDIKGQFSVKKVIFFESLDPSDWEMIKNNYAKQISFGDEGEDKKFFKEKEDAKYGSLIFIDRVEEFIVPPVKIEKRDRRGWVVLD